ncbi:MULTISPECIES: hypothetical protein [unclassified Cupriavidus]|uniref:hypothetical protein n=1 Tax=unclassified Cupriavidus TaxID=2640874 RepID=UPI001AE48561|nr:MULTISPECIES: hypothetical protein [unclassified Cupriavidus]MBP0633622.1 hypothetical protein [Cupriavidus sp. AcVe19-1a]MBP0639927.1 hypothetical protein [Cupriavidus sp. AcVe19-6a]
MQTKTITAEAFREGAREAVLKALDGYMRELTCCDNARGATDGDLPALFAGIDAHMMRVAGRFNPESEEVGSAYLTIAA